MRLPPVPRRAPDPGRVKLSQRRVTCRWALTHPMSNGEVVKVWCEGGWVPPAWLEAACRRPGAPPPSDALEARRIYEAFARVKGTVDSDRNRELDDEMTVLSIALQRGETVHSMRDHMAAPEADGGHQSLLGTIADALCRMQDILDLGGDPATNVICPATDALCDEGCPADRDAPGRGGPCKRCLRCE